MLTRARSFRARSVEWMPFQPLKIHLVFRVIDWHRKFKIDLTSITFDCHSTEMYTFFDRILMGVVEWQFSQTRMKTGGGGNGMWSGNGRVYFSHVCMCDRDRDSELIRVEYVYIRVNSSYRRTQIYVFTCVNVVFLSHGRMNDANEKRLLPPTPSQRLSPLRHKRMIDFLF